MSNTPALPDWIVNKDQALTFLEFAQKDYTNTNKMRTYYARAAKTHGITNKQIGEIFGITEGAVRAMLKRQDNTHEALIYSVAYDSGFKAGQASQDKNDA